MRPSTHHDLLLASNLQHACLHQGRLHLNGMCKSCCCTEGDGNQVTRGLWTRSLKDAARGAQLLVQQAPETIDRIVFLDAVILESGESFALNKIGWPAQVPPASRLPLIHYLALGKRRMRLDATARSCRRARVSEDVLLLGVMRTCLYSLYVACNVSESA